MGLVLNRRPGETAWIETADGRITITMIGSGRIHIEAPKHIKIHRPEYNAMVKIGMRR